MLPAPRAQAGWTALGGALLLGAWAAVAALSPPELALPSPWAAVQAGVEELRAGRFLTDLLTSLGRVAAGYGLAAFSAIPLGLACGRHPVLGATLMPWVAAGKNLSPLAWMPFAIVWFGVGHAPAIFLIYLACFFPLAMAAAAAAAAVPQRLVDVADEMGLSGWARWTKLLLPACAPALVVALRMAAGLAWMVVVAAEMIAGQDGLGFLIWDARNGLRTDLLVWGMLCIAAVGWALDRGLASLVRHPRLAWAHGA